MTMPKRIAHNAHREHPLVLRDTGSSCFRCDGCGCDGSGLRYRCGECDFDLHEHCATCPPTASVPFHAQHAVEFEDQAAVFPETSPRSCDLCGASVTGMHYFCRPLSAPSFLSPPSRRCTRRTSSRSPCRCPGSAPTAASTACCAATDASPAESTCI
ncbi:unnamed protein product [Miscanthus lutarioriparius]|uniref:DC1 domain-containing protein n=1 Tax=Miscanthus lutarioriparius TaxID=422564 RepID=A0A811RBX5_9POAL|nr:unnamed protein product [Miscanthus lutarioriparius]